MTTKAKTNEEMKKSANINHEWKNFLCIEFVGLSIKSGRIEPMKIGIVEIERINVNCKY